MKKRPLKKSNKQSIVLFGAGGHAKVIADIIENMGGFRIEGLVVPSALPKSEAFGYPLLSSSPAKVKSGVVAIGDNWRRSQVVEEILGINSKFSFVTAIHPSALLGSRVSIGAGSVVMPGACVNADARIGAHVIVNTRASIDHDCVIGDFASLGPGSTVGGKVNLGAYTAFGLGASCIHELSIGEHTVIGAGAVVVKDIPAAVVAFGNPCCVVRKRVVGESYYATKR